MTMGPLKKKSVRQGFIEFVKLQIAGNVPFWGTYALYALLDKVYFADHFWALLVSTAAAYTAFFFVDDVWVFNQERSSRKKTTEIWRFIIFTSFNALLVFNITWLLNELFGITPYVGQFVSAGLSISWTFIGYKFWVFAPTGHSKKSKRRPARAVSHG